MRSIAGDKQPNTIGHELTPTPEDDRPINGGQENGKCRARMRESRFRARSGRHAARRPRKSWGRDGPGYVNLCGIGSCVRGHPGTFGTRCRTVCCADIVRRRRKLCAQLLRSKKNRVSWSFCPTTVPDKTAKGGMWERALGPDPRCLSGSENRPHPSPLPGGEGSGT